MVRLKWHCAIRPAIADHGGPVGLECVGQVVEAGPEHDLDAAVHDPVAEELEPGIVLDLAPPDEARAEDAIVSLADLAVVGDDVLGRVREVRHVDDDDVAPDGLEPRADRAAEAARRDPRHQPDRRILGHLGPHELLGAVPAVVVDDDHLVGDVILVAQRGPELLDALDDILLFVIGGDDDGELVVHGARLPGAGSGEDVLQGLAVLLDPAADIADDLRGGRVGRQSKSARALRESVT